MSDSRFYRPSMQRQPIARLYSVPRHIGGGTVNDDFHEAPETVALPSAPVLETPIDRNVWALHILQRVLPSLRWVEARVGDVAVRAELAEAIRKMDAVSRGVMP